MIIKTNNELYYQQQYTRQPTTSFDDGCKKNWLKSYYKTDT